MKRIFTTFMLFTVISITAHAQVNHIVISAIYGGGSNTNAKFKYDFVELFNPTAAEISFTNWSIQYGSAAGTAWQKKIISATIPSGHYFLVQFAASATTLVGADLPTPDSIGVINMSATNGKVALANDTMSLSGATVSGGSIVDLIGFGTGSAFETKAASAASATKCLVRLNGGCTDTDNNSLDFVIDSSKIGVDSIVFVPRNSASPANNCTLLPVLLKSFTASLANNQVALKWETTSELDFNRFEIERSIDKINYSVIASVPASKIVLGSTYKFADEASFGTVYYRLKMIDNQGAVKYSAIASVNKLIGAVSVYPNPVVNSLLVNHSKATGATFVKIISIDGRVVANKQVEIGATQTSFDVSKLKNGNYILSFDNGTTSSTVHFVK